MKLSHSFYSRPTLTVAKDILGKIIVRKFGTHTLAGKIVEVEAYRQNDPASHSFRGMTGRNKIMFNQSGMLYVYFTYGMHFCANIVTAEEGIGEAVLIRAIEPIDGINIMMKNRNVDEKLTSAKKHDLTNGPAKFCQAFYITRPENGIDLCGNEIFLMDGEKIPSHAIGVSSRIGISVGVEKKWRFYIKGNEWVSKSPTKHKR